MVSSLGSIFFNMTTSLEICLNILQLSSNSPKLSQNTQLIKLYTFHYDSVPWKIQGWVLEFSKVVSWIGGVYVASMVWMYVCVYVYIKVLYRAKCSAHRPLHFSISRCPWKVFLTFCNCRQRRGLVWLMLYVGWKKNAQGKFNTIKSRTIHPTYHKTISSPSSTFFTVTTSLESFSVCF